MPDDLLADLWEAEQKGLEVFPKLEKQRVLNAYKQKDERKWEGYLYPSGMYWGMCLADHVYDDLAKGRHFQITAKGEERMAVGTMRHEEWQKLILQTRLLYGKPNYPQFVLDRLKAKKKIKEYPEVYICCDKWLTSGYADSVIKIKKRPEVLDFKTKNEDPNEWDRIKLTYPEIKEETQCYIYVVHIDTYKYYDQPIAGIRLCYYNNRAFMHKDVDPRYEYYQDIDPIKYQKTLDLLDEGGKQIRRYQNNEPKVCSYKDCNKHAFQ